MGHVRRVGARMAGGLSCPARFATPYRGGPSRLDECRLLARKMGMVLMPHQEQVLQTGTEMDEETGLRCTGRWS